MQDYGKSFTSATHARCPLTLGVRWLWQRERATAVGFAGMARCEENGYADRRSFRGRIEALRGEMRPQNPCSGLGVGPEYSSRWMRTSRVPILVRVQARNRNRQLGKHKNISVERGLKSEPLGSVHKISIGVHRIRQNGTVWARQRQSRWSLGRHGLHQRPLSSSCSGVGGRGRLPDS